MANYPKLSLLPIIIKSTGYFIFNVFCIDIPADKQCIVVVVLLFYVRG